MDTPTKQRLIGAAVLVALAVIFLPMLVKGPAPDSGVSDVPLTMPDPPADGMESRDLPLVAPQGGPRGVLNDIPPAVDSDRLPTVDTSGTQPASTAPPGDIPQPASVAAGDYAVHFGTYATSADADTIVAQLRRARLPGYREQTTLNGKSAWRVRVGPYPTRADAEAARIRAGDVRSDVGARVVVLDTDTKTASAPPATATVSQATPKPAAPAVTTEALPPAPVIKPAPPPTVAAKPVETPKPAPSTPPPPPAKAAPAASGVGYAVQVGAFGNAAEAGKLRDRLRAAGFTAFTETVNGNNGSLTRVRVGPVASRAQADTLKSQVSAKAGVSGIVRPYP